LAIKCLPFSNVSLNGVTCNDVSDLIIGDGQVIFSSEFGCHQWWVGLLVSGGSWILLPWGNTFWSHVRSHSRPTFSLIYIAVGMPLPTVDTILQVLKNMGNNTKVDLACVFRQLHFDPFNFK
jgi:hypothetical protein